jgi:hypothetical protein
VTAAEPEKLLPGDTEIVVSINVRSLLDSALVKKYALEEIKAAIRSQELLTRLNPDPLQLVDRITIAGGSVKVSLPAGGQPVPEAKAESLIIVHGRFDLDRAHELLGSTAKKSPDKVALTEHGAARVYEIMGTDAPLFGAFVDRETLILSGKKARVTAALDQSQGKGPDKTSKHFSAMLAKADTQPTLWVASTIPATLKDLLKTAALAGGGDLADRLEGVTLGVTVKDNIVMQFNIHTADAKTATQVRFGLEKAKALLTVMVLTLQDKDPDLANAAADLLSSIRFTVKDNTMTLRGEVTAETIEKALKGTKKDK